MTAVWLIIETIYISSVRDRQAHRVGVISAAGGSGREKEKIGYVPRGKSGLTASGLTSAGMMGRNGPGPDQTLDEESQARLDKLKADDEEIDAGLDGISSIIGNLGNIAGNMNSEVSSMASNPLIFELPTPCLCSLNPLLFDLL